MDDESEKVVLAGMLKFPRRRRAALFFTQRKKMFVNDGRRRVRWERFGMDDESDKDPAVFYNRILPT